VILCWITVRHISDIYKKLDRRRSASKKLLAEPIRKTRLPVQYPYAQADRLADALVNIAQVKIGVELTLNPTSLSHPRGWGLVVWNCLYKEKDRIYNIYLLPTYINWSGDKPEWYYERHYNKAFYQKMSYKSASGRAGSYGEATVKMAGSATIEISPTLTKGGLKWIWLDGGTDERWARMKSGENYSPLTKAAKDHGGKASFSSAWGFGLEPQIRGRTAMLANKMRPVIPGILPRRWSSTILKKESDINVFWRLTEKEIRKVAHLDNQHIRVISIRKDRLPEDFHISSKWEYSPGKPQIPREALGFSWYSDKDFMMFNTKLPMPPKGKAVVPPKNREVDTSVSRREIQRMLKKGFFISDEKWKEIMG
jgi:hypothetical protein